MGEYHPDERVRARRERVSRSRQESHRSDTALPQTAVEPESVAVPLAVWQEVVNRARLGEQAEKHRPQEQVVQQLVQPKPDELLTRGQVNLELQRILAMVEALRKRPPPD
jgi:hypothetical protein